MNSKDKNRSKKSPKKDTDQHSDEEVWTVEEDLTDPESSGDRPEEKLKRLKKKLKECEREKSEYLGGWLRAKSDLVNFKKRYEKEAESVRALTESRFAERLLPVMDSFSMAVNDQSAWEKLPEGWRKGMENVHSQLKKVFDDHGIISFFPKGQPFDPSLHEAIGTVDVKNLSEDNIIMDVVQEGYMYGDRLLRTAKVKVGHFKDDKEEREKEVS